MKKLKQIPRNNVLVVDENKVRAVFYHADPERRPARSGVYHPYIVVARLYMGQNQPELSYVLMGVN